MIVVFFVFGGLWLLIEFCYFVESLRLHFETEDEIELRMERELEKIRQSEENAFDKIQKTMQDDFYELDETKQEEGKQQEQQSTKSKSNSKTKSQLKPVSGSNSSVYSSATSFDSNEKSGRLFDKNVLGVSGFVG